MQLLLCARLWTWDPEELMACGLGTKMKTECITGYMTRQLLHGPVNAQAWGGDSREGFRGVINLGTVSPSQHLHQEPHRHQQQEKVRHRTVWTT